MPNRAAAPGPLQIDHIAVFVSQQANDVLGHPPTSDERAAILVRLLYSLIMFALSGNTLSVSNLAGYSAAYTIR